MFKVSGYMEQHIIVMIRQLLEALSAMHKHGICHRNLKLESIQVIDVNPNS